MKRAVAILRTMAVLADREGERLCASDADRQESCEAAAEYRRAASALEREAARSPSGSSRPPPRVWDGLWGPPAHPDD